MPKGSADPLLTYNVFFSRDRQDMGYLAKDEKLLLTHLELAHDFGFEAFVVDAIWFPGAWQGYAGPWIWDRKRFPRGGKPLADFCRSHGMKFGLWCGPGAAISIGRKRSPTRL